MTCLRSAHYTLDVDVDNASAKSMTYLGKTRVLLCVSFVHGALCVEFQAQLGLLASQNRPCEGRIFDDWCTSANVRRTSAQITDTHERARSTHLASLDGHVDILEGVEAPCICGQERAKGS